MSLSPHYPVMLPQVLSALAPQPSDVIVDGTLGAGGYSRALLDHGLKQLLSFDRDASAFGLWADLHGPKPANLTFCHAAFGDMVQTLEALGIARVDGIVLDLGVSSMQLDQPERGFSFKNDGPLDMRMDTSGGVTAADVVNGFEEETIANILWEFGEERKSRAIARAIVQARDETPLSTTAHLASLIRRVVRQKPGTKIDAATRSFQGLRIYVNDELGELDRALAAAETLLNHGGRLVVVSFHSLEDRRVKHFLRARSGKVNNGSRYSPYIPTGDNDAAMLFKPLSNKVIKPSQTECDENPRSRSALMRAAIRMRQDPSITKKSILAHNAKPAKLAKLAKPATPGTPATPATHVPVSASNYEEIGQ